VTAHANLRERYVRRALVLDLDGFGSLVWLTAVVFVEPRLNLKLTPFHLDPQVWVGVLGAFAFFLSIVQLRVDWKGRSDAHKRAFDQYDDRIARLRLRQAYGRLVRRADDRGVFVILDRALPSRLLSAFPPGVPITRVPLIEATAATASFLHDAA